MSTSDSPNKRAILALRKEEGNDMCADCGQISKCRRVVIYASPVYAAFGEWLIVCSPVDPTTVR